MRRTDDVPLKENVGWERNVINGSSEELVIKRVGPHPWHRKIKRGYMEYRNVREAWP